MLGTDITQCGVPVLARAPGLGTAVSGESGGWGPLELSWSQDAEPDEAERLSTHALVREPEPDGIRLHPERL